MPTDAMFEAMKDATRGDDVYQEDEATNELQARVAKMAGFEAGLFCPSGTMVRFIKAGERSRVLITYP